MTTSQKIEQNINKIEVGETFTYQQLSIKNEEYLAAAKVLERLIKKGEIKRVSAGIFYKPKKTVFGELKPREEELIKPYLFKNGERIAYVTGISLYNKMGLTTQIPQIIKIASRIKRITISTESIKATPVKCYIDVTNENYYLLQILDALKDFAAIPDLDIDSAITILMEIINKLNDKEIEKLMEYDLAYPPRVRAFLGALLEKSERLINTKMLKDSLNPFSEYKFGIDKSLLSTAQNWNMK